MPCAASSCAAWVFGCWRIAARMSPAFASCALRALHVQHRRLQHAAERRPSARARAPAPRADCSIDSSRYVLELASQRRQVGAAGREDALAVRDRAPARRAGARA